MSLVIEKEPWSDNLYSEMKPLLRAHYEEVSANTDIPLDPDVEKYQLLQDSDKLLVLTARYDGELVGYIIYVVDYNAHYKDSLQANQDVLFVRKDKRKSVLGAGYILLKHSERILRNMGVQIMYQHVKLAHDFSPFLEKLDYIHVENIYMKRIN